MMHYVHSKWWADIWNAHRQMLKTKKMWVRIHISRKRLWTARNFLETGCLFLINSKTKLPIQRTRKLKEQAFSKKTWHPNFLVFPKTWTVALIIAKFTAAQSKAALPISCKMSEQNYTKPVSFQTKAVLREHKATQNKNNQDKEGAWRTSLH